jgi:hypothetical protein
MQTFVNKAGKIKNMTAFDWYILQLQIAEAAKHCPQVLENTPYFK